jgi:hypothetical protein
MFLQELAAHYRAKETFFSQSDVDVFITTVTICSHSVLTLPVAEFRSLGCCDVQETAAGVQKRTNEIAAELAGQRKNACK